MLKRFAGFDQIVSNKKKSKIKMEFGTPELANKIIRKNLNWNRRFHSIEVTSKIEQSRNVKIIKILITLEIDVLSPISIAQNALNITIWKIALMLTIVVQIAKFSYSPKNQL